MLTKYHNFTTSGDPIKFTARSDYAITGETAKTKQTCGTVEKSLGKWRYTLERNVYIRRTAQVEWFKNEVRDNGYVQWRE